MHKVLNRKNLIIKMADVEIVFKIFFFKLAAISYSVILVSMSVEYEFENTHSIFIN